MNRHERVYTAQFFQVFVGVMLTMTGVSMQYHFGQYVSFVGFTVERLGLITGIGAVGSLFLRPYAGKWIDRLGCRPCFIASAFGAAVANFSFQFVESFGAICLIRVLMVASNATYLTTVAVYAAHIAPAQRRAESLGTIGIGGFVGMMIGPAIGDMIFKTGAMAIETYQHFFQLAALLSLMAGVVVVNLRVEVHSLHHETTSFLRLLRAHWPGTILLVAVVFSSILQFHMVFLERYAEHRGFGDIRWFFFVYAPTAIVFRLICRRVPQRFGRERVCVAGLAAMGFGVLALILVRAEWQLIIPAFLMGAGHSFVFPSMLDLAAEVMPLRHRGVGTSVTFGAGDIGFLMGGIAWGQLIDRQGFERTFIVGALLVWTVAVVYRGSSR